MLQEVANAPEALVVCGRYCIDFNDLFLASFYWSMASTFLKGNISTFTSIYGLSTFEKFCNVTKCHLSRDSMFNEIEDTAERQQLETGISILFPAYRSIFKLFYDTFE